MKGMVVKPILGYFSNNMVNSLYFTLKIGILHPQDTSKIIQLFIYLSSVYASHISHLEISFL